MIRDKERKEHISFEPAGARPKKKAKTSSKQFDLMKPGEKFTTYVKRIKRYPVFVLSARSRLLCSHFSVCFVAMQFKMIWK
jgi:hypothetical protein